MDPISTQQIISWFITIFLFCITTYLTVNTRKQAKIEKMKEKAEAERRAQDEKDKAEALKRSEMRRDESILTLTLLRAVAQLSNANSMAIINGKVNGEMTEARQMLKEADSKWNAFMLKHGVEALEFD